eukprot:scaffold291823_cov33-Tisochrysis_lutea.AAC.3
MAGVTRLCLRPTVMPKQGLGLVTPHVECCVPAPQDTALEEANRSRPQRAQQSRQMRPRRREHVLKRAGNVSGANPHRVNGACPRVPSVPSDGPDDQRNNASSSEGGARTHHRAQRGRRLRPAQT